MDVRPSIHFEGKQERDSRSDIGTLTLGCRRLCGRMARRPSRHWRPSTTQRPGSAVAVHATMSESSSAQYHGWSWMIAQSEHSFTAFVGNVDQAPTIPLANTELTAQHALEPMNKTSGSCARFYVENILDSNIQRGRLPAAI